MVKFSIPIIPPKTTGQAGARILKNCDGRYFIGRPKNSAAAETREMLVYQFGKHAPEQPLLGPLVVEIIYVYPFRKCETAKNKKLSTIPCDTKPDADGIAKMPLDVLQQLKFYKNDSQIADLRIRKFWGHEPRIEISIKTWQP